MTEGKLDLSKVSVQELFSGDPMDPGTETEDSKNPEAEPEGDPKKDPEVTPEEDSKKGTPEESKGNPEDDKTPEGSEDEKTMFEVLKEKLGYEVEGEFSEDYDGLVDFTKKMAGKLMDDQLGQVFNALPDVGEYMQYRLNGGDPKTFFQNAVNQVDFSTLEIKEDDETAQTAVVAELLRQQGYSNEDVKETIEDLKDTGLLYKQALKAQPKVVKAQAEQKERTLQQQAETRKRAEEENIKQWKEIQQTIDSGVVQGFIIPEADKKAFFEWMAVPVDKEGKSKRALDREKMSKDQMLAMEYLFYKGFDLNKLVQNTKQTQQAVNLRNKLQTSKPGASVRMKTGAQTSARGVTIPGLNELF